ncbi:hypothetical protein WMO24_01695 [Ruthenibacterium sp. CLA-JM-H11]|uniref:Uncharacterized protein n=1 Tax=Ruthenibacterium intestinale TaxID=3133163 RepID=A0ABV1GBE6_9FIRM
MAHETQKAVLQAICLQDRFFVLFLKISGRNCLHREGVPFDADVRKNTEGTLCGCRGGLTMQPRKRGSFPASFPYGTPAKAGVFLRL